MKVIKSSGIAQEFDPAKIIQVLEWSVEGTTINPYELYERAQVFFKDEMTTTEIQRAIVKVAADSIQVESADYQYVASNLAMFGLRKEVFGQFDPPHLYDHVKSGVEQGVYDKELLTKWSKADYDSLNSIIDHDRDFNFTYAGAMQVKDKYLVKDRSSGKIYETPQFMFILIGMCLHQDEPLDKRIQYVKDFYDATSLKQVSLPTPILAGVRTPTRQFSSCVLIETGDSLDSITESTSAIVKYVSKRAGIGIGGGAIRAEGSKIGPGEVKHTGVTPFWKLKNAAVHSCSQGGIRKGSATAYWPIWHLECENLMVLKNNKGIEENRIRHMDYGIQLNNLMIERYLMDDYVTLFSPDVLEGKLYDAFFRDENLFRELYENLEKDPFVRKKRIKATELFMGLFMTERANTARLYPSHVDNINNFGPWIRTIAPVKMSNLCAEIALHTVALGTYKDQRLAVAKGDIVKFIETYGTNQVVLPTVEDLFKRVSNEYEPTENEYAFNVQEDLGEIALCTLSAWVLDNFDWKNQDEVNRIGMVMVRALDNLLDYQDYPHKNALKAKEYRSLGIGVTNFAAWLASQAASYEDGNELTHELFERLQYALIKASIELAKEKGPSPQLWKTKYGRGELPIDWYCKNVDELVPPNYVLNWEALRIDLKEFGMRNVTLSAQMPCESSSQVSNSTNGIEKPLKPVTYKQSKDGSFNQMVPNYEVNQMFYDFAWESAARNGNKGYLTQMAIEQKWTDQAISINTYYVPNSYENGKVPMSQMMDDMLFCFYFGNKNMYYHNTDDGSGVDDASEADCDACKL
ncbi:ribonucleotide reductase large subunit [Acinetobacter phage ZZ1]|jgi:ribonucleoside-diphosphate reductase alpha chain|uniref:Ribonucleoside-diphosphate reductase n=3 Tax=Caudoviricetes TaxID=2731619 RepID=A0A410T5G3_9CAUD|nr:ribonucleotide reductase large subunit [Acinetobacter phage ZZ1]AFL47690.1 aerobic NDP reductase large subunit [Acinetobacter phage ZZ1]QAU03884.1 aerobic NDP reductase large subunit [Acinetobacter phage Henu6]